MISKTSNWYDLDNKNNKGVEARKLGTIGRNRIGGGFGKDGSNWSSEHFKHVIILS